jgi:hypothetical protein
MALAAIAKPMISRPAKIFFIASPFHAENQEVPERGFSGPVGIPEFPRALGTIREGT